MIARGPVCSPRLLARARWASATCCACPATAGGWGLRQWAAYLEELRKEPNTHLAFYKTEVRLRVLLELLGETLPEPPESPAVLDEHFRPIFEDGEFLWDQEVQGGFPPEDYWFLYGKLAAKETTHT